MRSCRTTDIRLPDSKRGQAMVEYVFVAVMLIATVAIMAILLYTFKEHSGRVIGLVASEYP